MRLNTNIANSREWLRESNTIAERDLKKSEKGIEKPNVIIMIKKMGY
jgi:hypothetical protein